MIKRLLGPSAMPPLRLHDAEALLWEGVPSWSRIVLDVFHVRAVGFYFALLLLANGISAKLQHLSPAATFWASLPLVIALASVLLLIVLMAHVTWRAIRYSVTTDRVVVRYGVALVGKLSIPHKAIAAVSVAMRPGHTGDIPLQLRPGHAVSFWKTWPLVRPWHFAAPQPMLRGVPQAGSVASILARTVAAACAPAAAVAPSLAEAAD